MWCYSLPWDNSSLWGTLSEPTLQKQLSLTLVVLAFSSNTGHSFLKGEGKYLFEKQINCKSCFWFLKLGGFSCHRGNALSKKSSLLCTSDHVEGGCRADIITRYVVSLRAYPFVFCLRVHLHRVLEVVKAVLIRDRVLSMFLCSHAEDTEGGMNPPVPSHDFDGQPRCTSAFRRQFSLTGISYSVVAQLASRFVPPVPMGELQAACRWIQQSKPCRARRVCRNGSPSSYCQTLWQNGRWNSLLINVQWCTWEEKHTRWWSLN